ncbi:hypothetical protein ACX0G7_19590 [Flavitalea antarctica]
MSEIAVISKSAKIKDKDEQEVSRNRGEICNCNCYNKKWCRKFRYTMSVIAVRCSPPYMLNCGKKQYIFINPGLAKS